MQSVKYRMTEAGNSYSTGICPNDTPVGVYPADAEAGTAYHVVIEWRRPGSPREADFAAARASGDFVFKP